MEDIFLRFAETFCSGWHLKDLPLSWLQLQLLCNLLRLSLKEIANTVPALG